MRIGVFVCHCGRNIAGIVDVKTVVDEIAKLKDVVFCTDYIYLCSEPGQKTIQEKIKELNLTHIIVAACSPSLHGITFSRAVEAAGVNPYLFEMVNIREQCSWVHSHNPELATKKAISLIKASLAKLRYSQPLTPIKVPLIQKVLVIGGGIAGIRVALDIAQAGFEVCLVEKSPSLGGRMAQLSETFPTLDCSSCILTPLMVEVARHKKIHLFTYAEVKKVEGIIGNFKVTIEKKPRYVIPEKCTGCGDCVDVCPVVVPNEFDQGLGARKAIYVPFPQAVPLVYTIDFENCLNTEKLIICEQCFKICGPKAIDFLMRPEEIQIEVGAIVVATGYELLPLEALKEYGAGEYEDVITSLDFERLISASGPTGGILRRPSDGRIPKSVVFIQCAGSRSPEQGRPYCSKICCMYTAKHALIYKHLVPDGEVYVFYIDIRAAGKRYEEFVQRVMGDGVLYLRGKVSKVFRHNEKMVVLGVDTLSGKTVEVETDLVVLAPAIIPSKGAQELAKMLKIPVDEFGFFSEIHPKLRPVETTSPGIYLAGAAQSPKDISETVAQASAAASKVLSLLSQKEATLEPIVAYVDKEICKGCGLCRRVCPFKAITIVREDKKRYAKVEPAICQGCGCCMAICEENAINVAGFTYQQLSAQVRALLEDKYEVSKKTAEFRKI
ncbi:MAG: CoB--CoM heterodisulfide reductase iron-sulfur subunit A family protein [Candidatus Desulfofervidus auxilii]|nr:CoB--CoM heterodisulfide reductase iron-sulfur subunit A family protein [Candidatus Desulfofervidus auxilii]